MSALTAETRGRYGVYSVYTVGYMREGYGVDSVCVIDDYYCMREGSGALESTRSS